MTRLVNDSIANCLDVAGDIGPFQLAIALTFVTLLLILPWRENYGDVGSNGNEDGSPLESIKLSVQAIARSPSMICLGLSQAFFEGGMYTFGRSIISFILNIKRKPNSIHFCILNICFVQFLCGCHL